jgi:hypothetical protein
MCKDIWGGDCTVGSMMREHKFKNAKEVEEKFNFGWTDKGTPAIMGSLKKTLQLSIWRKHVDGLKHIKYLFPQAELF